MRKSSTKHVPTVLEGTCAITSQSYNGPPALIHTGTPKLYALPGGPPTIIPGLADTTERAVVTSGAASPDTRLFHGAHLRHCRIVRRAPEFIEHTWK
jgi:hypothetical protein